MPRPQDILPLPLPPSPALPHLLQGAHPSVQLFLNQWVIQGLGHPIPITPRLRHHIRLLRHPTPITPRLRHHIRLPLVDLPLQAPLHRTIHLHPTILGWVALLTLLRLVVLLQEDITIIQPAVLRPADLTLLRLVVLHQEDLTTTRPAVLLPADPIRIRPAAIHQAVTPTLQLQQHMTEESLSLSQ